MNKLILALTLAFSLQTFAAEDFSLIATARPEGSARDIERLANAPGVATIAPLFSPDEQRFLKQIGRAALASAMKITLKNANADGEIASWIKRNRVPVSLEPRDVKFTTLQNVATPNTRIGGASFENLQWGYKNQGQAIPIALDDLTSLMVQGRAGEDVGVTRAPKENLNPGKEVRIAILDTGLDFSHPELLDRVVENTAECKALAEYTKCTKTAANAAARTTCDQTYKNKDADGNGYPLDCSGWNMTAKSAPGSAVWGDNDARDLNGHGTHVAGVIAARSDDGDGVSGIAQNVRILGVKVISASPTEPVRPTSLNATVGTATSATLPSPEEASLKAGKGFGDLVARGLLYAIRSKAQIINMSLGWPADVDSNLLAQLLDLARSQGILVVAAAGNDGTDALIRPCIYTGVICVGSHDPDGALSHFSNHGPGVDVAAPGLGILSLFPTALTPSVFTDRMGYEMKSGTSMASPAVVGVLARILNTGASAKEAYARLLLGTRPLSPNPRLARSSTSFVQTGAVDLGRSLEVQPQPVIMPVAKRAVEIHWNRRDSKVSFSLELENLWTDAERSTIEFRLLGRSANDAALSPARVDIGRWSNGESKSIPLNLEVKSSRLESELSLEAKITTVDLKTKKSKTETRVIGLEVLSTPDASDPDVQSYGYRGDSQAISLLKTASLRSVVSADGKAKQDYVAVASTANEIKLVLLSQGPGVYDVSAVQSVALTKGELLALHRADVNLDGKSDYILVWRIPPTPEKKQPSFLFRFFDERLRPMAVNFDGKTAAEAEFNNAVSVITERFQWMRVGQQLVPAWISRGTTPESEKAAYDPWNPSPIDLPEFRIYYWGPSGLKSLREKDQTPIALFYQSRDEQRRGVLRAAWLKGEGTDSEHVITSIEDAKIGSSRTMDAGGYRRLRANSTAPLLNSDGEAVGTSFYTESSRSTLRLSGVYSDGSAAFDKNLAPLSKTDSVLSVLSGFIGKTTTSITAQTIYEMQFTDLKSGDVVSTSLRRFSFLPGFFFMRLFFPVIGDSTVGDERSPMVYLPAGLGTTSSAEVLAPRYESGRLVGLIRPARLRLLAPTGCVPIGNAVEPSHEKPSQIGFTCGDRILMVPLKY
ncbi:MAG: S8 family serine peptidase [Bdellovibrionales bacterium]|nr:S8 family serine peptidase [Bdellovibrionales bacterium]